MRATLLALPLLTISLQAGPMEDAARALAMKIAGHIAADERIHFSSRNMSALSPADALHVRTLVESAAPKHLRAKNTVDVALTLSENAAGYVWVAEIGKGDSPAIEMVTAPARTAAPVITHQLLSKRLLWQQAEPILDFAQLPNRTLLLTLTGLTYIADGHRTDAVFDVGHVRDPRGRLEVDANSVTAFFPGTTCRGTLQPLHLDCEEGSSDFTYNTARVHLTPGRNTLEGARVADDSAQVCGNLKLMAGNGPRDAADVITLAGKNSAALDQIDLPGPVTALWPTQDGGMAVVHNIQTEQYAAYALSVDCPSR